MCGINGILGQLELSQSRQCVESMNKKMAHRGPDADGIYQSGIITLGHRRLSIIDLDIRGNQPMHSFDARYTIVFNGEIYNFKELKEELLVHNIQFKSSTDTEVLLYGFSLFKERIFLKLRGMFAGAIWDHEKKELLTEDQHRILKILLNHMPTNAAVKLGVEILNINKNYLYDEALKIKKDD